jgi:hypothetical protein
MRIDDLWRGEKSESMPVQRIQTDFFRRVHRNFYNFLVLRKTANTLHGRDDLLGILWVLLVDKLEGHRVLITRFSFRYIWSFMA